ncbi:MAG: hypothetical protein WBN94_08705 [Methanothrix sp.]
MAAFKSADAALDYSTALQWNTGHPQIQIRAGIHIGPMHVEEGDVFGGTVNFAARVVGAITGAEIWLSDRAKEDIDRLGAVQHKRLGWAAARWRGNERLPWHIHAVGGAESVRLRIGEAQKLTALEWKKWPNTVNGIERAQRSATRRHEKSTR